MWSDTQLPPTTLTADAASKLCWTVKLSYLSSSVWMWLTRKCPSLWWAEHHLTWSVVRLVTSPLTAQRRRPLVPTNQNPHIAESMKSVSPVMGMSAPETGVVKPPVVSLVSAPFPKKPFLNACPGVEKKKGEWLVVVRARGSSSQRDLSPRKPPRRKARTAPLPLPVPRAMRRSKYQ